MVSLLFNFHYINIKMAADLSGITGVFNLFLKLRDAFLALKKSNLFLKETDIYDLIEKYFALEQLPKGDVILFGKLSNFTLTNNLPVYSPVRTVETDQRVKKQVFNKELGKLQNEVEVITKMSALNIPAISHNTILLEDGSSAKILWLYNEQNDGLILDQKGKKLDANDLLSLYDIKVTDRPIPVLVDVNFPSHQYLYRKVKIKGRVVTANASHFETLSASLNPFLLNYMGNYFRPFSNNEAFLALDLRNPYGTIENLEKKAQPFNFVYSVQGVVDVGNAIEGKTAKDLLIRYCLESIPDRQGMEKEISSFGYQAHPVYTILSIGEINWQYIHDPLTFAAFIEIDASNVYEYQSKIAKLSHHYQLWQKQCRALIRKKFYVEPKIYPIICSNSANKTQFHPNGLQIPIELEKQLLSHDPMLRKSIDWLEISTGKK
jgi:hypothetical protein